jgi:4-alpha-glucanotransferase
MSRTAPGSPLVELAQQYGIQTSYVDVTGQQRRASPEALLRVLKVLGAPLEKVSEARSALRQRLQEEWGRGLAPAHVLWEGGPGAVLLRLPARQAQGLFHCRLVCEGGSEQNWSGRLDELKETNRTRLGRTPYVLKQLDLPGRLPLGYHQLTLEVKSGAFPTLLLSAPHRAYQGEGEERSWGVFVPLYALHSQHSWGCGDLSDLGRLLDWTAEQGGSVVGALPLLAAFLEGPCEISPYSPISRLFWNELYLDVSRAPELDRCEAARAILSSSDFAEELLRLRNAPQVEYCRVAALKRRVLAELARAFFRAPSERQAAFERFLRDEPLVRDYAAFRAAGERLRQPWRNWPTPLRQGTITTADYDVDHYQYHLYVQWLAAEQMQALSAKSRQRGPGAYLDLPLGVHADGYDTWRHRQAFAHGVCGGAPPDVVFPRGQNWGFPPLHPEGIRTAGYHYVRAYVHKQMQLAGILRIDHAPNFHRLFWVPEGLAVSEGVYVRYPAEELYALFNLESHRHRTRLVGEDLGTVPQEVHEAMDRHGYQRMYVIEYELQTEKGNALPEPPADSVASINTHDMPPFAAFWQGQDVDLRQQLKLIDKPTADKAHQQRLAMREALEDFLRQRGLIESAELGEVLRGCLRYLAESPARLFLVNLEDLWLETRPHNVPSTVDEYPNWRHKGRYSLEEIEQLPVVRQLLAEVASGRRLNSPTAPLNRARRTAKLRRR